MNVLRDLIGAMCLVVIGAAGLQARGAVLAYDGFDYPEAIGTSIAGLNGGTGWTEAYPTPSGTIALADGLSFSGFFPSTGKAMQFSGNANLTTDGRNWTSTLTSGTYWYSFLVNPITNGTNFSRGTFGLMQGAGTNQNGFGIRMDFSGSNLTFNTQTPVQAGGVVISFPNGWGSTYTILGRLVVDTAANTTNSLWVYSPTDTLPTAEPTTAMSTVTGATSGAIGAVYGRAFGDSQPIVYDEIRVGETFADVMPVPEPASVAAAMVAGLGGLGLLARRRLRRHV